MALGADQQGRRLELVLLPPRPLRLLPGRLLQPRLARGAGEVARYRSALTGTLNAGSPRRCHGVKHRSALLLLLLAFSVRGNSPAWASPPPAPAEVRAVWVDAFGAGIRSADEAEELVLEARRANLNLLFVQVRRRADALYLRGTEPPLDDPRFDPQFDALENVIRVAHREGLKVHAWINAMPVWRNEPPPCDARHLFHRHGPAARGDDMWLTTSPDGSTRFPVGTFLDPGHPAVQAYLPSVYTGIVRNYDVDGIHFDYIRYPETESEGGRGAAVGYNPTALARFRKATARSDTPAPDDEQFTAWRRRQVTHVVRRVALEVKALKPGVVVSASVIPWGAPPTGEPGFEDAAPMQRVFQDWHSWLKDGLVDLAVPMNYARETEERTRGWFDGWIDWESRHQHQRRTVVGLGAYRNTPDHTLAQIERVRRAGRADRLAGISIFSYASPAARPDPAAPPAPVPPPGERLAFLSSGTPGSPGAFPVPAPIPSLPWIEQPKAGAIAGIVVAPGPGQADDVEVEIRRRGWFRRTHHVRTDANGFFGLTRLAPGTYRVRLATADRSSGSTSVEIEPGRVTRVEVGPPTVPTGSRPAVSP
ncbi:hypothetical protein EG835_00080 [bacterium]|nr:hypothetical protein [bacterium]